MRSRWTAVVEIPAPVMNRTVVILEGKTEPGNEETGASTIDVGEKLLHKSA